MDQLKTILIIEDNSTYRNLLKLRLDRNGYRTLTAPEADEGLRIVKDEKPDLILLDLMLPRLEGHEVCRTLKSDREVRNIPVVVLTCRDWPQDVELMRESGADAYILKSTRSEILMQVIQRFLVDEPVDGPA